MAETLTFSEMIDEFVHAQVWKITADVEEKLAATYGARIATLERDYSELKAARTQDGITLLALRADLNAAIKMIKALQDGQPPVVVDPPVEPPVEPEPPVVVDPKEPPTKPEEPKPSGPGVFFDRETLRALPIDTEAFKALNDVTGKVPVDAKPDLSNQDDQIPAGLFACGMVYNRLRGHADPMKATMAAMCGAKALYAIRYVAEEMPAYQGRALALARKLLAIVMTADLIDLKTLDPALDMKFRVKLYKLLTTPCTDGPKTLIACTEERPNNWGTWSQATCAAVYAYDGDTAGLAWVAKIFKGWLGDRRSYAGFRYGDLAWQADKANPVGVNPPGALIEIDGRMVDVDGALPEEMRRGKFAYPFPKENYAREAEQGVLMTGIILQRNGYPDVWGWQAQALRRIERWLVEAAEYPADGDDRNSPHIVDAVYGTSYAKSMPTTPAKSYAGADWWAAALPKAGA